MRSRTWVPTALAVTLVLSLAPLAHADDRDRDDRGAPADQRLADGWGDAAGGDRPGRHARDSDGDGHRGDPPAKPRDDTLVDVPVNPADASIPLGLVPYHEFAPRLRELQASDRISVEIVGRSVLGRDLHLVVATSPMSDRDWREWQRLSDLRTEDPAAALELLDAGGYDDWRTPLFVNNNIHGNEWEGTDSTFQILDELAVSDEEAIVEILDRHVIAFVVSMNPDGRVAGTRANANGFDMNRDFITQAQPENQVVRDQLIRYEPVTMLDMHGYVGGTLIEPTTGPHGENYEWDLYIRNALPNALAMEERIFAENQADLDRYYPGTTNVTIPFRDFTDGWDDWPPIFTPMYAMYHGAVGHTIEVPLNPRGATLTPEQRLDRTRINTNVGRSVIEANLDWATGNRDSLLRDQIELFRRGEAGEPSRPIDDPLALSTGLPVNLETFPQDYPDAYVVPVGEGQRSEAAAARLVDFLLDNDVEVTRARTPVRIAGQRYPAGTYVVDMHQPKRGMANVILDLGRDVTTNFPTMYDISAWSPAALWGATVVTVDDADLDTRRLRGIDEAGDTGSVPPGRHAAYSLTADTVAEVQAVNDLLAGGADVRRLDDGTLLVDGRARDTVRAAAAEFGVRFDRAGRADWQDAQSGPEPVRVGVAGPPDELFALARLGFPVTSVTADGFNAGTYAFDDFDALYVGSTSSTTGLDPARLDAARRAELADWLAGGGTVVGRGEGGVAFNEGAGLLPVTAAAGREDANGIVAVVNDPDSVVAGGALDTAFVSSPWYFTAVGDGVAIDQSLAAGDFFLAGHWIGQEAAEGRPVVVSGAARGADVTLFGTEPLYRNHPEGMFPQVAEALWR
ncbi:MAG: M14 family zinc carboxypeptidase [Kineosporiaceae bacterium]